MATPQLVTMDQVNLALRLDLGKSGSPPTYTDERTPDIQLKLDQSTDAVLSYLKGMGDDYTSDTVPPKVTAAIILGVGSLLDDSGAEMVAGIGKGDPSNPIVALLYDLRDPALA